MKKPVMLVIMDGWGINENKEEKNAIREAKPRNLLKLEENYPHARLQASGEAVGLPEGQMGNSEVGHLNIGAGRVVYQPLVEISVDIRKGDFFRKAALVSTPAANWWAWPSTATRSRWPATPTSSNR